MQVSGSEHQQWEPHWVQGWLFRLGGQEPGPLFSAPSPCEEREFNHPRDSRGEGECYVFIGDIYFRDLTVTLHCVCGKYLLRSHRHTHALTFTVTPHRLSRGQPPLIHKNPQHGTTSVFTGSVEHGSSSSLDNLFFHSVRGLIPNRSWSRGDSRLKQTKQPHFSSPRFHLRKG